MPDNYYDPAIRLETLLFTGNVQTCEILNFATWLNRFRHVIKDAVPTAPSAVNRVMLGDNGGVVMEIVSPDARRAVDTALRMLDCVETLVLV